MQNKLEDCYDSISGFTGGLARVKKNNKFGVINKIKKLVVPIIYDYIWCLKEGYMRVNLSGKLGLLNKKGEVIIKPLYNKIDAFYDKAAKVYIGDKIGLVSSAGIEIAPVKYSSIEYYRLGYQRSGFIVRLDNEFGLLTEMGAEILPVEYIAFGKYSSDLFALNRNGTCIIFRRQNRAIINLNSSKAYFVVLKRDSKYGVVNSTDELIVNFEYDFMEGALDDFVILNKLAITHEEIEIVACEYNSMTDGDYVFVVVNKDSMQDEILTINKLMVPTTCMEN